MSFPCCFLLRKIMQARKVQAWLAGICNLGTSHSRQGSFVSGCHDCLLLSLALCHLVKEWQSVTSWPSLTTLLVKVALFSHLLPAFSPAPKRWNGKKVNIDEVMEHGQLGKSSFPFPLSSVQRQPFIPLEKSITGPREETVFPGAPVYLAFAWEARTGWHKCHPF